MEAYTLTQHDTRERKRSMRLSILIHAIILALIFIPFIKQDPIIPDVKAIIIQFSGGGASEGAKPKAGGASAPEIVDFVEETEVAPEPIPPEPKPVKTLPAPPIVTADNDAPSMPQIKDIKVPETKIPEPDPEPEPEVVPDPEPEVVPDPEPEVVPENKPQTQKPKQTDRVGKIKDALGGLFGGLGKGDGSSDSGDGENDGNGTGDGKEGDGDGDSGDSGSGNGTGSGDGDGDFDGIGALTRKVIFRPNKDYRLKTGKVAVNICIDRLGSPTKIAFNKAESTIFDRTTVKAVLNNVRGYKFEPKSNAPRKECGIIKIIMENETGFLVPGN